MIELAKLRRIEHDATVMLKRLASATGAEVLASLKPEEGDYEKVFTADVARLAHDNYERFWISPPRALGKNGQTEVLAVAAPSDAFATENELSNEFPGGYRKIADKLQPELVWLRFKFVRPGETSGMAYDGLVWLNGRWAWFPKPWRVLLAGDLPDEN
jgi:hypothetical protein